VRYRLEPAAEWPESTATSSARQPPAEEQRHSLDVIERGELLGRLTVVTRPGQDLSPVERRLFAGVAAQAGLILRVAGLRTELQQRLAELEQRSGDLRRSRREIVTRQDAERQRLERDIHDGAQQEVLALLVNLRLAQTLLGRAPDRAVGVLAQQAAATRATIRTLEELSRGLYPATLGKSGPVPALRAAAARGAVPVTIIAPELPRLPGHVETTLYFGCLEALQNAAKHASATQVTVHVRPLASGNGDGIGGVEAQIIDDGVGFDATGAGFIAGRGLQNLRDRVDAAHGALDITSAPGAGTRLVFSVPVLPATVFPATVFSTPDGGSA
jgi:signal transduction histidine kinase